MREVAVGPAEMVLIELPVRRESSGYRCRRININLNAEQAEAMRMLFDGMAGVQLKNGRRVANAHDVVKYMLEQVAVASRGVA